MEMKAYEYIEYLKNVRNDLIAEFGDDENGDKIEPIKTFAYYKNQMVEIFAHPEDAEMVVMAVGCTDISELKHPHREL